VKDVETESHGSANSGRANHPHRFRASISEQLLDPSGCFRAVAAAARNAVGGTTQHSQILGYRQLVRDLRQSFPAHRRRSQMDDEHLSHGGGPRRSESHSLVVHSAGLVERRLDCRLRRQSGHLAVTDASADAAVPTRNLRR
jgi:hypothetical protein